MYAQRTPRAGKAGKTTAGTSDRAGQAAEKKQRGKTAEELAKIQQDNEAMQHAAAERARAFKAEQKQKLLELARKNKIVSAQHAWCARQ
jgi:hypothetical protein